MAKGKAKVKGCWSCGAEIRPDTQFCYSCGKPLAGPIESVITENAIAETDTSTEVNESLVDLERALGAQFPPEGDPKAKLTAAAAQRRTARRGTRKQTEVVWEPVDDGANRLYFLIVLLIFVVASVLVYFTVFSK
ncbi:MAG: zinc ribbon domain-containing protein [Pyrinomonadaceae bacterium]|nr:zinc ribbon domain-containing protein [Pyrinomonadaceae bacterium]MBP6211953.1 zinc ribbon domain-containing protein [Pyrinomonadaceae bacterium]